MNYMVVRIETTGGNLETEQQKTRESRPIARAIHDNEQQIKQIGQFR